MGKGEAVSAPRKQVQPSLRTALQAIDAALVAVRAALESTEATEPDRTGAWITQDAAPCGRRVFMKACRVGLIKNARKVGRRWIAARRDFELYMEEQGRTGALSDKEEQGEDRDAGSPSAEVLRELERAGLEYVGKARKTGR